MATMRRLRGDFARAVRMPLFPGVPLYGVTWVSQSQLILAAAVAQLTVLVIHMVTLATTRPPAFDTIGWLVTCANITLVVIGWRRLAQIKRFGRLPLTLDPSSPRRGSQVPIRIALNETPSADAQLTARVSCMRFQFRPYGRSYRVYGEPLWQAQTPLQAGDASSVEATILLPADQPASSLPNGPNHSHVGDRTDLYGWVLEVFDEAGRIPVKGYYRLPVE